jgi:hypothetical protein
MEKEIAIVMADLIGYTAMTDVHERETVRAIQL